MWNCTDLDLLIGDATELTRADSTGGVLIVVLLSLFGGCLLFAGEQLVRPLGALAGGVGGALAAFVITAALGVPCEARLVTTATTGVLAALLALLVIRYGIFLLGAAGLAAATHFVYDALPLQDGGGGDFRLLGHSGYYYIAMAVAVVLGGVVSYVQRGNLLRIASSLLGAGSWTLAVFLVCEHHSVRLPSVASLVILLACTLGGVGVQRWRSLRRKRARRSGERGKAAASPVVGVPLEEA